MKDLTGLIFGDWEVLSYAGHNSRGLIIWLCRCVCGVEREVTGHNLKAGQSKGCGCKQKEKLLNLNGKGEFARNWKGGRYIDKDGYIVLKRHDHPNARKNGYIFEHIFIMSEHLKRPLYKEESVHHKNGIRNDNRIDNLELWVSSHPNGQRVQDLLDWAHTIINTYEDCNR